jgi:hypothetical protein
LMTTLLNSLRLIAKNMNKGKVIPNEATANTSLFPFYSNTKLGSTEKPSISCL